MTYPEEKKTGPVRKIPKKARLIAGFIGIVILFLTSFLLYFTGAISLLGANCILVPVAVSVLVLYLKIRKKESE